MFKVIAGPCVIESREQLMEIAGALEKITRAMPVEYYFKASFDKANRTSVQSFRGPGMAEGLKLLAEVKSRFGFRIVTDIHTPEQAAPVAEVADVLQIPAFLCRQTDLLLAAAGTGKIVNVKKAQFLAPEDMLHAVRKIESVGNNNIWLCERGTTFGYHNLVVDMTGIARMKQTGYPVIMDATHSAQRPGGNGSTTGGNRDFVPLLAKAATAAGADGLFLETHYDPDNALSDGPNMVRLSDISGLLGDVLKIHGIVGD